VIAIRFGLRCQFLDAPIRFRTATHRYVWSLTPARRRTYLRETAADNAAALSAAATDAASRLAPTAHDDGRGSQGERAGGGQADGVAEAAEAIGVITMLSSVESGAPTRASAARAVRSSSAAASASPRAE
jgi:hypothetical protein